MSTFAGETLQSAVDRLTLERDEARAELSAARQLMAAIVVSAGGTLSVEPRVLTAIRRTTEIERIDNPIGGPIVFRVKL